MLLETVDKDPKSWVTLLVDGRREISNYLAEQTGIKLSGSQVRRILKRKKYSYVWAKYSLEDKQNPEKRAEFREKLAKYLAQRQARFYADMGGTRRDLVCHSTQELGKKGKRKKITGQRRRGRVNVMGGVSMIVSACVFYQERRW